MITDRTMTGVLSSAEKKEDGMIISILGDGILVKGGRNLLLVDSCINFDKLRERMVFESADYGQYMCEIIQRHREKYSTPLSRLVLDEVE